MRAWQSMYNMYSYTINSYPALRELHCRAHLRLRNLWSNLGFTDSLTAHTAENGGDSLLPDRFELLLAFDKKHPGKSQRVDAQLIPSFLQLMRFFPPRYYMQVAESENDIVRGGTGCRFCLVSKGVEHEIQELDETVRKDTEKFLWFG